MREIISTREAGAPVGVYSQAVKVGNLVWTAGMGALDPKTGELVHVGDVKGQTVRTLENLQETLKAAGTSLEHAVRVGVFLSDMSDFAEFNDAYKPFFPKDPPARTTVQAGALPVEGLLVEIEVIAAVPE